MRTHSFAAALTVLVLAAGLSTITGAQAGEELLDPNTASEQVLAAAPHMTPAIVKAIIQKRPFRSITVLNAFLVDQKLTPQQTEDFYRKAFVRVNLNTATREEILLIPGAGTRMVREFMEYRPWKTKAQFEKEIGKYVGAAETARLWKYVEIK